MPETTLEPPAPETETTTADTTATATETPAAPTTPTTQPAPAPAAVHVPDRYVWGTGRRKTAVARVRVKHGDGTFKVNDKPFDAYFSEQRDRNAVMAPIGATNLTGKVEVLVNVTGGGYAGQAGAVVMGLARALTKLDSTLEGALRDGGYLTRDDRMVERKKPGMAGARKRFQFSKR